MTRDLARESLVAAFTAHDPRWCDCDRCWRCRIELRISELHLLHYDLIGARVETRGCGPALTERVLTAIERLVADGMPGASRASDPA